jgi:histidyl-tRNA synthetase
MSILDCKNERCQNQLSDAPKMLDHLCEECDDHFSKLQSMLTVMNVPFQIDENIVRGLDYYTKTAFEFISRDIGAQSTVCGGGRYDGLMAEIGDIDLPGVGFGMGIERLLLTLEENDISFDMPSKTEVFIIVLGEKAKVKATGMAQNLRTKGIKTEMDHLDRSLKAQFKYANKIKVPYVVVMGEEEVEKGEINLKKMSDGTQITVAIEDTSAIIEFVNA